MSQPACVDSFSITAAPTIVLVRKHVYINALATACSKGFVQQIVMVDVVKFSRRNLLFNIYGWSLRDQSEVKL